MDYVNRNVINHTELNITFNTCSCFKSKKATYRSKSMSSFYFYLRNVYSSDVQKLAQEVAYNIGGANYFKEVAKKKDTKVLGFNSVFDASLLTHLHKDTVLRALQELSGEDDLVACLKRYTLFKNISARNIEGVLYGTSQRNEVDIYAGINIIVTQEMFRLYNNFCQSN